MTVPAGGSRDVAHQDVAERIAAVVTATPGVAGLDGGIFGAIATYLPGRRLTGVRVGEPGEPVEVGVVVVLGRPIPETVRAVRRAVAGIVAPGTHVDITVADVATSTVEAAVVIDVDTTGTRTGPTGSPRRRVL